MNLPRYDWRKSYAWNYERAPAPVVEQVPTMPGLWEFCGLPVDSPLGISAGPLLNGGWCLYYASLGFDVLTYKTVRSVARECFDLPNLVPVPNRSLASAGSELVAEDEMHGSWAISFGMPSAEPRIWRADVESTRNALPAGKILNVSCVASMVDGWSLQDLADDYAQCAVWAQQAGADTVELNFSCPNVSTCDGQLYQQPNDARVVAETVRERVGDQPLIAKVGYFERREEVDELLEHLAPTVDAVALTNAVSARVTRATRTGTNAEFGGLPRGIGGTAIRTACQRQLELFHDFVKERCPHLRLVAGGGISDGADVQEALQRGASAVHMATAAMLEPRIGIQVKAAMKAAYCDND